MIRTIKDFKLFNSVKTVLNYLKKNYIIIVITNQPDVGRKKNTKKNVEEINHFLMKKLPIKKIFTCYCATIKCKCKRYILVRNKKK